MATNTIAEAFVDIKANTKNFANDSKAGIEKQVGTIGASAGKIFAGAFSAATVGIFLKGSIAEAQEARKTAALTAAVIKSTGGVANVTAAQVDKLATKLSLVAGVDDELIAAGENVLLRFTNIRNEVGAGNEIFDRAITLATDMAAALGTDAAGAAGTLGKALNNPIRGLTLLGKQGVAFTDQEKAAVKADVARGDILSAQKILLDKLATSFGGAAASQATAQAKLSVVWKNIQEQVGTALLPLLDDLANGLSVILPKAIDDATKAFAAADKITQPIQDSLSDLFKFAFDPSKGALGKSNWDRGIEVIQTRLNEFLLGKGTADSAIAQKVAAAFAVAPSTGPAAGESGLLGITIADTQHDAQVLAAADANASTFEKIVAKTANIISDKFNLGLTSHASTVLDDFKTGFAIIQTDFSAGLDRLSELWATWGDGLSIIAGGAFGILQGIVKIGVESVLSIVQPIIDLLHGDWSKAWDDFAEHTKGVFSGIETFIGGVVGVIRGIIDTLWQGIGTGVTGVLNGIISGFEKALNFAIDLANSAIDLLDKAAGPFVNFGEIPDANLPRIGDQTPPGGARRRVQQLAGGGAVMIGGAFWVGENGPELALLPGGAQVVPNRVGVAQPLAAGMLPGQGSSGIGELHVNLRTEPRRDMTPLQQGDLIGRAIAQVLPSLVA